MEAPKEKHIHMHTPKLLTKGRYFLSSVTNLERRFGKSLLSPRPTFIPPVLMVVLPLPPWSPQSPLGEGAWVCSVGEPPSLPTRDQTPPWVLGAVPSEGLQCPLRCRVSRRL